ncbi:hypothetical protein [Streptomyces sp. NRRL B-1347]|uniref:hypothetical protein n=1 Tax=Streptomyces sp. NRRL B-1347 TaxID=1476877 RepID=UPI000AA3AF76|nr:hypothetical protein [Streptomyces sp. NRRL B-1347]
MLDISPPLMPAPTGRGEIKVQMPQAGQALHLGDDRPREQVAGDASSYRAM